MKRKAVWEMVKVRKDITSSEGEAKEKSTRQSRRGRERRETRREVHSPQPDLIAPKTTCSSDSMNTIPPPGIRR